MTTPVIRTLRDLVPLRALSIAEAFRVAEFQATKLLELSGVVEAPVDERIIANLPRMQVERMTPTIASGATQWSRGRWLILLAGSEPKTRQRFTLAHEFKHVLDHPFVELLYPTPRWSDERVERICEFFAACVLMPKAWVKRAYCNDKEQDVVRLARRFGVSPQAMEIRLMQIGLTVQRARCATAVDAVSPERVRLVAADLSDRTVITVEDFARLIGISRSAAYEAAKRGDFPVRRLGRRLFVPVPALKSWLGVGPEIETSAAAQEGTADAS